jgi:hypothetical protein
LFGVLIGDPDVLFLLTIDANLLQAILMALFVIPGGHAAFARAWSKARCRATR